MFLGILGGGFVWGYQIVIGLGVTGLMHPTMWVLYLVNFVFWVGIAHSGTLISAILYLFRAKWRTPIARSAEAMTVFAVMIAGLFPLIHLGRVWIFYWIIPYPNQRTLWPDFQSPLIFDFLAISTYLTVSVLFWYTGLIPDLAAVRDRAQGIRRKIYGFFSLGWTGTDRQWHHYGTAYLLLAGLATPLVVSVHSVVSWDFALTIIPGYHSTIFAPYFVAGAIHSGLAMVLTLLIPLRRIFHFEKIITVKDLESVAKTTILTGLIVGYSYIVEYFMAWYSGNIFERQTFIFRAIGHYAFMFWIMVFCNAVAPLFFFFKKSSNSPLVPADHRHPHQYRHVVRTLCDHHRVHGPGFYPLQLGLLSSPLGGAQHHRGILLPVPVSFSPLCEIPPFHLHCRDQGGPNPFAQGKRKARPPWRMIPPCWAFSPTWMTFWLP